MNLVLQVFLNTNLRVKPCYCVTSFLFILISSLLCLKSFFNDCTKLQGSCSSCGSVQLCVMEERASWLLRVMTCQSWHVMWCWHLLATAPQKKKKLLSEKVPLRYRWKLTANEGQRKRERTCSTTNGSWLQSKGSERGQVQGINLHFAVLFFWEGGYYEKLQI